MASQLYLITPTATDPERFPQLLEAVLGVATFSAVLVRRGDHDGAAFAGFAKTLVGIGQRAGCAVLVEDDAALARSIGADGVHVSGDIGAIKAAAKALKPGLIVGAGPIPTRHDAMTIGELDVDYLLFGPLAGDGHAEAADLAEWWAATFEIPAVLSDPAAGAHVDPRGAEFLALSDSIWSAPDPAAAARAIVDGLGPA